jgi:phosphatidylglycerophosphatase A
MPTLPILRPDWRFMLTRFSRVIALGQGSGLSRIAPGTVGTLWAWVLFNLSSGFMTDFAWSIALPIFFLIGCWACSRTGKDLGVSDHGSMVWDEMVAFWLVLWILPAGFVWQLVGFGLFRFFDAVKPPPVSWADRHFKGGFGVMFDDLIAALMTLLTCALLVAPWLTRVYGE